MNTRCDCCGQTVSQEFLEAKNAWERFKPQFVTNHILGPLGIYCCGTLTFALLAVILVTGIADGYAFACVLVLGLVPAFQSICYWQQLKSYKYALAQAKQTFEQLRPAQAKLLGIIE